MKKLENDRKQTYTIKEAKRLLGVGTNAVYNAAHRGEIPVIKIGGRLLVPKAALDRMLNPEPLSE